jgi:hypothetical protein
MAVIWAYFSVRLHFRNTGLADLHSRMAAETLGQLQHTVRLNVEFQFAGQTQDAKSAGQGRCIVH